MTAEIVNLRRVKKRLAREAASQAAEQARARHSRTKAQRDADAITAGANGRTLDGARIETPDQS